MIHNGTAHARVFAQGDQVAQTTSRTIAARDMPQMHLLHATDAAIAATCPKSARG